MHFAGYVICATPRSGSTLLCDLLTATGVAGRPNSFYRRQSIANWIERFGLSTAGGTGGPDFERAYLAATIAEGTGDTGCFGTRMMAETRGELLARLDGLYPGLPTDVARFEAAFGPLLYIHLSRPDRLAQAISRVRAEQTGLWHMNADRSERERVKQPQPAVYDADRLAAEIDAIVADDTGWNAWFRQQGIEPVRVTYEELAADPRAVIARILLALGRDPSAAAGITPRTAKMADAESAAWAARFLAEWGPVPAG
ncbi:MAG TPA: Stf0 family sulfotransferase [Devosia sp.]